MRSKRKSLTQSIPKTENKHNEIRPSQKKQDRMALGKRMTQAKTQTVIETAKAAIKAVRVTDIPVNTTRPAPAVTKRGGPVLKQPTSNWKYPVKYLELCNFEIEVKNILTKSYDIQECEKVSIIMNWLGCEELSFVQALSDTEQEECRISAGLFEVLSENFKLQHNETIQ